VLSNSENFEIVEKVVRATDGKKETKKFAKGGSLHLYPSGTYIYLKESIH
jgi:hypothetical protein